MKVAFITPTFPSREQSSLGIFNFRAAKSLSAQCDISIYKMRMWKPGKKLITREVYEGMNVFVCHIPMLPGADIVSCIISSWLAYFFLRKEIKREGYDILFSSGINFSGLVSSYISRYTGIKHVAQVIGSDVNYDLPKLLKLGFDKTYYRGVHGIVSVCRELKEKLASTLPEIRNVEVIYRGIDLEKFQPVKRTRTDEATQFLFLGGFPKGIGDDGENLKGGITLINLWKKNEEAFHTAGFRLLVGGVYSDKPSLQQWHQSLKYPAQVELLGVVNNETAKQLIVESDIILLPSLGEGLPNIAVESAALSRMLIGSHVNGVPEIVIHEQTGITLPPADEERWAQAMLAYGSDKTLQQQFGNNARKWAEQSFDSRNFAPAVIHYFKTII